MNVILVQKEPLAHMGLMCIQAFVKQMGHQCEIMVADLERNILASLSQKSPGLIGFYGYVGNEGWIRNLSRKIKEKTKFPIIVGGPCPTVSPERINEKYIDYLCRGEGELGIRDLLQYLEGGPKNIKSKKNIVFIQEKRQGLKDFYPLISDLDVLPFPDFSSYLKYPRMYRFYREAYPIMTGRGCPFKCSYCINNRISFLYRGNGKYVRKRSPEVVIGEMKYARRMYGVERYLIEDENFITDRKWLENFIELYQEEIRLPFVCSVMGALLDTDVISMLKEGGCTGVKLGVEVGNEDIRKILLKKQISNEELETVVKKLQQCKIRVQTFNMVGLPGTDIKDDLKTFCFNLSLGPDFAWCSIFQPYPGTEIACRYIKEEEMSKMEFNESYFLNSPMPIPRRRDIENLQKLMGIGIKLKLPSWAIKRLIRLPLTGLYHLLFRIHFAFGIRQIMHISLFTFLGLGMRLRKNYMILKKRRHS